eukprot:10219158-Lingulodinium_polyedra.AAC.1
MRASRGQEAFEWRCAPPGDVCIGSVIARAPGTPVLRTGPGAARSLVPPRSGRPRRAFGVPVDELKGVGAVFEPDGSAVSGLGHGKEFEAPAGLSPDGGEEAKGDAEAVLSFAFGESTKQAAATAFGFLPAPAFGPAAADGVGAVCKGGAGRRRSWGRLQGWRRQGPGVLRGGRP